MVVGVWRVVALGAIVLLAGCNWYAKAGSNKDGPWIEGGVSGTLKVQRSMKMSGVSSFEAEQFVVVLEASGTSITNTSGQALVTLLDGSTVIASRYFQYINNQGNITAADPAALESWANGYPNATELKFNVADLVDVPTANQSSLTATTVYNGEPVASATTSWSSTGGGGCREARCHQQ